MTEVELLAEVEDLLRLAPAYDAPTMNPDVIAWVGRTAAVIKAWSRTEAISISLAINHFQSHRAMTSAQGYTEIMTTLNEARYSLRMQTVGPLSVAIDTGGVFDYFDEVRTLIETTRTDILFIDPYLDAEFVSRYLVHVPAHVAIRLLAREKLNTLTPAVEMLAAQISNSISVRSAQGYHDRYIILDGASCYQSGASFKDGAKKSPTTLTQIVDAFEPVRATYETIWNNAAVIFQS